jgi:PAS domain S-box-containing protein
MPSIANKTVIDYIYNNDLPFKGEKNEYIKRETLDVLITPLKVMALLIAISGLFAMVFEVRYFSQFSFQVYLTRLVATLSAFVILVFLYTESGTRRPVLMVHLLLLVIIISSGYMIYLIPKTLIVNSHIVGLMIFTSALFLSWEVKNQIIVAIYYNIVFAAAILLNGEAIYFLPNMYESVIFVIFLSLISVVGSAVNFKLRMLLAENSFRIKLSEQKFRSIFDNSAEGIFQTSPEGQFLTVNIALCELLGYTREEILSKHIGNDIYFDPSQRDNLLKEIETKGEVKNYQITLKKKGGAVVIVKLNSRLIIGDDGKSRYYEGNLQDVTAQVKAEINKQIVDQALREEKQRADMLAREAMQSTLIKSQFLANMSHEIRTPMNGIIGFLSLILQEAYKNKEELSQFALGAKKSADSLLGIINDILDLSKIESGKMELYNVDFNLSEVIDESVSTLSPSIKEKNLTVSSKIEENSFILLNGDSTRVRQIFLNLISNAVKFTEKGGITISIRTMRSGVDIVTVFCTVSDSGIGIPGDKLDALFKPFSQVDGSHTRKYGGTGLGLVICKEFVSMMGGEIWVQSEVNKGSSFFFTLKLNTQLTGSHEAIKAGMSHVYDLKQDIKTPEKSTKDYKTERIKHKILLAEDNFINQKVCLRILSEAGFSVDTAVNGFEAIEAVKINQYSLILMDVQMPECDGFTATKEIRQLGKEFEKIPVIAITAHSLKGDKEKCIDAGMNDYISKPIVSENLIGMIDKWLKIETSENGNTKVQVPENRLIEIFDFMHLDKMSLGNEEFQKDLIITFIDDTDKRFKKLKTHLETKDLEKFVNEAHTIKGASLSIGAVLVGRNALIAEMSGKQKNFSELPDNLNQLESALEKTKVILTEHFSLDEVSPS